MSLSLRYHHLTRFGVWPGSGSRTVFDTRVYSSTFNYPQIKVRAQFWWGNFFFFSWPRAGLTNRVPVRDSRAGAPLEYLDKAAVFDARTVDELNKIVDVLLVYVGYFATFDIDGELAAYHRIKHRLRFSSQS